MNAFLQIPKQRRLLAFQQVDAAMGLQAVSVEKDFWACSTKKLSALPTSHEKSVWPGTITISGVYFEQEWETWPS